MLLLLILLIFFCFAFVILFGAPYLPTLKHERALALQLLDLKPGQTLLELGSGDGRLLNEAAKQGIKGVGYELNPILLLISKIVTFKNRRLVTVNFGNYWLVTWPKCDGIYVFLLDKYMYKLSKTIERQDIKGIKILSYGFEIKDKQYKKKQGGFFLYQY